MWRWLKRRGRSTEVEPAALSAEVVEVGAVFTPGSPANKAFVPRPTQEKDLKNALRAAGTQVVVYGESGAGKSSLSAKVLTLMDRPYITTRCTADTDYLAILTSAFSQAGATTRAKTTIHEDVTLRAEGTIGSQNIASIKTGADWETGKSSDDVPVVASPLTAENVVAVFGKRGLTWVIEDFHKVQPQVKAQIADALKVFSDRGGEYPKTAIIILGAADTPGDVWGSPSNMNGRLASIEVPPLTDDELGKILDAGGSLLNVDFSAVRSEIIRHSVGVASVTHALAFNCCDELEVEHTAETKMEVDQRTLDAAKAAYVRVRTADMKAAFDKALEVRATRKFDNCAMILRELAEMPESGGTHAEILARIRSRTPDYPAGNLTKYLGDLQEDGRGSLVRKTAQGKFRFDKPLQHTYAQMLFELSLDQESGFWSANLVVAPEDRQEAIQLADEEQTAAATRA